MQRHFSSIVWANPIKMSCKDASISLFISIFKLFIASNVNISNLIWCDILRSFNHSPICRFFLRIIVFNFCNLFIGIRVSDVSFPKNWTKSFTQAPFLGKMDHFLWYISNVISKETCFIWYLQGEEHSCWLNLCWNLSKLTSIPSDIKSFFDEQHLLK